MREVNRASSNCADMLREAGAYESQLIGLYTDDGKTMEQGGRDTCAPYR